MRAHVVSFAFDGEEVWLNSTSFEFLESINMVVLHPNQVFMILFLVPEVDTTMRSLTVMWDGSLVVAANNKGTCYVWRLLRETQTVTNFEPFTSYMLRMVISSNVSYHPSFVNLSGYTSDLYLAIASSDSTVKIWNVDGFTLEKTLVGHQRWVWNWVFSVDGAYLITASSDTTARLWSLSTGEDIRLYQGHQFMFMPNGTFFGLTKKKPTH
uniref:Target of rapamycin complex subunit LST8 n=1 Tax=Lactuca sativa TaxID=4236 RepID=A0A9R1VEH7_LACSA|nr:hypothetical protein LSAT_V11C500264340 [Lactuca sativa]